MVAAGEIAALDLSKRVVGKQLPGALGVAGDLEPLVESGLEV